MYSLIFLVPTQITTRQGVDLVHRYPLEAAALQKSPRFVLAREDPAVYTNEDLEGYNPSREWPEEDLPKAPEPQAAPTFSPELIKKGLSIHHLYCDWLKALGVDPCKEYANQGTQAILEAVVAGDTVCPICTKPLKTTQRLRSHIKGQHMESTPQECKICKKSFGDNYTLSLHEKTHGEKPYKCPATGCTKAYPSASRLKEHSKVHNPATSNFHCQYRCGKVFPQKKNCIQHEEHCPQGPKKPKIQCPYCPKKIQRLTDLKRHAKKKHPSRDLMADVVLPQVELDNGDDNGNGDNGNGDGE